MFMMLQADYFGIAATAYLLLTGQYMSVVKDPKTNLYQPQKPLHRYIYTAYNIFVYCTSTNEGRCRDGRL